MRRQHSTRGMIPPPAIALAHELGMTVVAEGVEDADTVSALQAWDCDAAQGYFFGKPVLEPSFEPKVPGC